jgi:hypothetical protein
LQLLSLFKTSPYFSVFIKSILLQATKSEVDICPDVILNDVLSQPYIYVTLFSFKLRPVLILLQCLHYGVLNFLYIIRAEDNIRMDLQEVGWGCEDWIGLAQDSDRWRALVSAVMNLRVP